MEKGESVMSLTVGQAATICEKFRSERNSEECICHYLAMAEDFYQPMPVAFLTEGKLPDGHPTLGYEPTKTRRIWRF